MKRNTVSFSQRFWRWRNEKKKRFLEILERQKRSGSTVSVHDVGILGAGDPEYVLWKHLDLRVGNSVVGVGYLPRHVEKSLSTAEGEPSFFEILFEDREMVSAFGQ